MWLLLATVKVTLTIAGTSPSGTPPAGTATDVPAAPVVRQAQRESAARRLVLKHLKPWVRSGDTLIVRTAIVGFNGDARNPITGKGPVSVFVRQKSETKGGRWDRFMRRFDKFASRRFVVDVDRTGRAHLLYQESLADQHRFGRFLKNAVPAQEVLSHAIHTKEGRDGLTQTGIGLLALSVNQLVAGGFLTWGFKTTLDGLQLRHVARNKAFDATVKWARREGKSARGWPNLVSTYDRYRQVLRRADPGTLPVSILTFAEMLRTEQL